MLKRLFLITCLISIILLVSNYSTGLGAEATSPIEPGTVNDPIITKSYFELNVKKLISDEVAKQNVPNIPVNQSEVENLAESSRLSIIKLEHGQSLYGGSGTEFIVRTGKTIVFSNDESGIADVTIGKDIIAGQAVELNHMLIVPREGRGIKPDPKNNQEIYVMVRGSYLLTNADGSKVSP